MDFNLAEAIDQKLKTGQLVIPTLPEVGMDVMREMESKLVSSASVARVLLRDPTVSARVIRIANSSLIGATLRVTELRSAITRIGLNRIRNIVISIVLEQLFVSDNASTRRLLKDLIKHRISIACAAAAVNMFSHVKQDQDSVLLFSMLQNVGILPVIAELDRNKIDVSSIDFNDPVLDSLIRSITIRILNFWGLPEFAAELSERKRCPSLSDFTAAGVVYLEGDSELDAKYAKCLLGTDTLKIESISNVYKDIKKIFV